MPGSGANLLWQITVLGLSSTISSRGMTSYAPPFVSEAQPLEISTDLSEPIQLIGSNFGISDVDENPVVTFVEIHHNGNVLTRGIDISITEDGAMRTYVKEHGVHVIAFLPPHLDCKMCSNTFQVKVKTISKTGAILKSPFHSISFKFPTIDHVYVTDGETISTRHCKPFGFNASSRIHAGVCVLRI